MTAPLTIELAGRRLPALRFTDRVSCAWSPLGHLPPFAWCAILPAGERDRVIGLTRYVDGDVGMGIGPTVAMMAGWDDDGTCSPDESRLYGSEAEALAQIVAWSSP